MFGKKETDSTEQVMELPHTPPLHPEGEYELYAIKGVHVFPSKVSNGMICQFELRSKEYMMIPLWLHLASDPESYRKNKFSSDLARRLCLPSYLVDGDCIPLKMIADVRIEKSLGRTANNIHPIVGEILPWQEGTPQGG